MSRDDRVTATRRFGLGARPGELAQVGKDPRGYLMNSLDHASDAVLRDRDLKPSHEILAAFYAAQMADREARKTAAIAGPVAGQGGASRPMGDTTGTQVSRAPAAGPAQPSMAATSEQPKAGRPGQRPPSRKADVRRNVVRAEFEARVAQALTTRNALVERLVMFWSNHFAVAMNKGGPVRVTAGAFEREAIRPHVLGRFTDMLLAVEKHPAMLIYLDNNTSIGPGSKAGARRGKGLNENLGREILELHTVGAGAGYSQDDVTNLARILTGWTVAGPRQRRF
ncbi:MAG: DUF1800 family protein, partial [Hyphomicrobiaceae bacterium]